MNVFDEVEHVDLTKTFSNLPSDLIYELVTDRSKFKVG